MKVLIIPEDPTHDQFVLKPVVERLFEDLERPANIEMLTDPHMTGIDEALDPAVIQHEVVDIYPMYDLFVVIVDRDCNEMSNEQRAQTLEQRIDGQLVVCLAREEVEAWMLYLLRNQLHQHLGAGYSDVRNSCDPKDDFAIPLLRRLGWTTKVGNGRKKAMRHLGQHWQGLKSVCDELREFEDELRRQLQTSH